MSVYHRCEHCRVCTKCGEHYCNESFLRKYAKIEEDYLVERCPNCGEVVDISLSVEAIVKLKNV